MGSLGRAQTLGTLPSSLDGLTAFATGGQGGATPLTEEFNRITVSANATAPFASVQLPVAVPGQFVVVCNSAANPVQVFGGGTDTINALTNTVGVTMPGLTISIFCCISVGLWHVLFVQPPSKYTSVSITVGTLAAGLITGAEFVTVMSTNAAPGTQTTRTATQMFQDAGNVQAGDSYILRITNTGAGTWTLAAGAGVTLGTGTYTVPTNTFRDFTVTFTTATALTIQTIGVGTWS